ncbi:antibiotic biosynthesis monooxygenase family protein [Pseudomonas sp. RC10]|uniref:putative quinol monooxygenase n=1 Tax=Pseudomonas bambusae TaxID=3139142 RepID=UPI003138D0D9
MLINAVSTLQIEGLPGMNAQMERLLSAVVPTLKQLPGCLGYEFFRNPCHPHEWIITGCWASQQAMHQHFEAPSTKILIWATASKACAVRFASFDNTSNDLGSSYEH